MNENQTETVQNTSIFPAPFTIGGGVVTIAVVMSKIQSPHTFLIGGLYSLWSLVEMGSIAIVTYLYVVANTATVVGYEKVGSTTTTLSLSTQYL